MKKIKIFAYAAQGLGLSGSDRIFIEFARRWREKVEIEINVTNEGFDMCTRQKLIEGKNLRYKVLNIVRVAKLNFVFNYLYSIWKSVIESFSINIDNSNDTILYSASEFWMDSLPAFILKLRYPNAIWAAAWYQTAPNPIKGYTEGDRDEKYTFKALLYWLSQLPIKPLISNFADFVLVNNEIEKKQFSHLNTQKKVIVVLGAVDLSRINSHILRYKSLIKKYDAVFQGRFHPQKGVVELIDIWRKVVNKKPGAKLAMIGDGPLMESVKLKVKSEKLEKNVKLFGYVFDGDEKYRIFAQSKIVVHPAFYDSGGMAAAEAMAFGLSCVGFDLPSYKSYYPKGMIKVKIGNLGAFAETIIELLSDNSYRKKIGTEAFEMINKDWSWDKRASEVLELIK